MTAEAPAEPFDFEAVFHAHYRLYWCAVRTALDELRRRSRRERYERWFGIRARSDDPERTHTAAEERIRISVERPQPD